MFHLASPGKMSVCLDFRLSHALVLLHTVSPGDAFCACRVQTQDCHTVCASFHVI